MFKKYAAFAAAMVLTVSVSSANAQHPCCNHPLSNQACQHRQGCCTTQYADCKAETGCNPTCNAAGTTISGSDTTCATACCTNLGCATTCSSIGRCNPAADPTAVPQAAQPAVTPVPEATKSPDAQEPSTGDDYTTPAVSMQEQKMLNLLNQDRKNNGLAPLTMDPELSRIARIKSEDMRDHRYFAHQSPTWGSVRDMLRRFGYAFNAAGENIAHHATVDKAQAAFMSSSGHRANILSAAWTKVGIGVCYDAQGFIYATQIFTR